MFDRITVRRRLTKGLATLSVIGLMTTAAACGSDDGNSDQNSGGDKASGKVFFLVPNATTPAWPTYYMPAVEKAVEEMLPDVELVTESADNDPAKQLSQVEAAIAQQAAAVIISPPNPAQAGAALAKLAAADIPAIGYLNDPNGGPVNSYVWVDFATIGEYWGQWLRDNLEKEVGHSPVRLAAIYGDPTFKVYDLWLEGIKPELDALVDVLVERGRCLQARSRERVVLVEDEARARVQRGGVELLVVRAGLHEAGQQVVAAELGLLVRQVLERADGRERRGLGVADLDEVRGVRPGQRGRVLVDQAGPRLLLDGQRRSRVLGLEGLLEVVARVLRRVGADEPHADVARRGCGGRRRVGAGGTRVGGSVAPVRATGRERERRDSADGCHT